MQLAPGAWRMAALPLVAIIPLSLVQPAAGVSALLLAFGVFAFYRDPDRTPPDDGILSPADGKVSVVREEENRVRIGVFMNVTDVHVNRAPLAGTVREVTHEPGANRPAFSKDSDRNEKVRIAVETPDGAGYEVVLIAGWFARRIHPYVDVGDELTRGERIGHISFGSRADVILPEAFDLDDVCIEMSQRTKAGESVVAIQ